MGAEKRTAWDVWRVFPELTPVLRVLKASPKEITDDCMSVLERFVFLLYDCTSSLVKVNEVRQELFSKMSRNQTASPLPEPHLSSTSKEQCSEGVRVGPNPPSSASASKPIRLGMAATKQLMVTVLDSPPTSKGHLLRTHPMWM